MRDPAGSLLMPFKRSTLWLCAAVSLALHAALLSWLPGWTSRDSKLPADVLAVELVSLPAPVAVREAAAIPPPKPKVAQPRPVPKPVLAQPLPRIAGAPAVPLSETLASTDTPRRDEGSDPGLIARAPPAPVSGPVALTRPADSPATPPSFDAAYLRNPPPRYPASARRKGEEGTVLLRVLVDVTGNPLRVELDRGSGHSTLDGAGIEAVKRWKFVPARRGAQPVEAWVRVPLTFRLDNLS
jgi:protein TonB